MSSSNYKKKKLLINFNEIKKEKTKLKTIKYINSDLIHFEQESRKTLLKYLIGERFVPPTHTYRYI